VRMALVSGRPISFKMDLYTPLYVPRPTETLELFAGLRPVAYSGALDRPDEKRAMLKDEADRIEMADGTLARRGAAPGRASGESQGGLRWRRLGRRRRLCS